MEPADRLLARRTLCAQAAQPLPRVGIEQARDRWLGIQDRFAGHVHLSEDCSHVLAHAPDVLSSSGARILTASSGAQPRSASSISA